MGCENVVCGSFLPTSPSDERHYVPCIEKRYSLFVFRRLHACDAGGSSGMGIVQHTVAVRVDLGRLFLRRGDGSLARRVFSR